MIKAIKESEVGEHLPNAITEGRWYIFCPGCYEAAKVRYADESPRLWINSALHCFSTKVHGFNENREKPTLSPSLLVQYEYGEAKERFCCHSFVKDGMIQFLGDCTHPLRNQTVELMDAQVWIDANEQGRARTPMEDE